MLLSRLLIAVCASMLLVPPLAKAEGIDGPGRYAVFRTLDSGLPPTEEQNRRCDGYFGTARASTAAIRLDARLFAFRSDPMTGRVTDQTAGYLGPGFICGAPAANEDAFEAFAYTGLPGVGEAEATGPCAIAPIAARPPAQFFNCKLQVSPEPGVGLLGGVVTGNSIVNPGDAAPSTPTGSIWTAYLVHRPGTPASGYAPPAAERPPVPSTDGLDFYVFRSFEPRPAECGGGASSLARVEPRLSDGILDAHELLYEDATATLCITDSGRATAQLTITRGGAAVTIAASGDCRELPTPAGEQRRQQTCRLPVDSSTAPGSRGGLITTTGLVDAASPTTATNSHIWTVALFADAVTEPADTTAPLVTLRVPKRSHAARVRVRWQGSDDGSRIHHYVLQRKHGKRWRDIAAHTTATATTLRLKRGQRVPLRVRAVDRAGNASAWVSGRAGRRARR